MGACLSGAVDRDLRDRGYECSAAEGSSAPQTEMQQRTATPGRNKSPQRSTRAMRPSRIHRLSLRSRRSPRLPRPRRKRLGVLRKRITARYSPARMNMGRLTAITATKAGHSFQSKTGISDLKTDGGPQREGKHEGVGANGYQALHTSRQFDRPAREISAFQHQLGIQTNLLDPAHLAVSSLAPCFPALPTTISPLGTVYPIQREIERCDRILWRPNHERAPRRAVDLAND